MAAWPTVTDDDGTGLLGTIYDKALTDAIKAYIDDLTGVGGTVDWSAAAVVVSIKDAEAAAVDFKEGSNSYLKMVTTNGGEKIVAGKNFDVIDDVLLRLGTNGDQVLVNRSTSLTANTVLTDVLIGTPVTPAIAANTLIISNITSNGDILIAGNDGGTSKGCLYFDASAPDLKLYNVGGTWTAGATTWNIPAFTLGGKLTAGASEIEGSNFDINGGTIDGVSLTDITMSLGSDADGDVYYRASNKLTRLAKGAATEVLTMNVGATAPEWAAASGGVDTSGTPVDDDFAKFTDADTIEGRSYSEVRTDLGLVIGTNVHAFKSNELLEVDGTAGRVVRHLRVVISDGTNANTLKCSTTQRWNGDVIGEVDNIAKGATTGNWTLSAAGQLLRIEAALLSGNVLMAFGTIGYNASGSSINIGIYAIANDIEWDVKDINSGANKDLTALVDVGDVTLEIFYITDA